ncbi:putative malate dehydrogenase [Mycena maculata]|uniref:Malate dehydrogenase n=1 Tax=Mycena maculata TaxID=230809 RepID=A0AAD7KGU4_9AGAR|nr:putative malate dehydrogenase [Mycena maculata]
MLALTFLPLLCSAVGTQCDISGAQISLPSNQTALVAPSEGPSFIGVAIGVQNYTCASTGTWTNVGAVAELFDISCLYGTPEFSTIQEIAFNVWKLLPPATPIQEIISFLEPYKASFVLGQHYFVTSPSGTGLSPKWDFTSGILAENPEAFVIAAKVGDIPAPTGSPDVDWLSLDNVEGDLAKQVFRVSTVNGDAPTSCTPGSSPISVKYAATYCEPTVSLRHFHILT